LISFPDFLVAVLLVTLFAIKLQWLPAIASIRPSYQFFDWVRILILPVAALMFTILAHMVRMTRSAVLNVLASPAIEMAILKGVPRRRLLVRHALPNAFGPIINVVALNLAYLISGVVVIETLFNYPGLGRFMVEAVTNRDVPIVQACAMIFCSVYVLLNLIADILSILANPRVRYPK
jgi:peptide/nickel transport system permease protein